MALHNEISNNIMNYSNMWFYNKKSKFNDVHHLFGINVISC